MVRVHVNFKTITQVLSLRLAIKLCFFVPVGIAEAFANPNSPSEQGRNCMENKFLIIGLGRVGVQVAQLAIEKQTAQVFGTVRGSMSRETESDSLCSDFSRQKIIRVPFDPVAVRQHLFGCEEGRKLSDKPVAAASHVLFTIPLSREDDPLMVEVLNEIRKWWATEDDRNSYATDRKIYDCCNSKVLGILSTTGVYGNHDGDVVTEDSPLLCDKSSNAFLYRKFEDEWISLSMDDNVREDDEKADKISDSSCSRRLRIFRCAGIYDSSRSAIHTIYKSLKQGKVYKTSSSTPTNTNKTNRIHSIDLARGVLSGMFQETIDNDNEIINSKVRIYNISDDQPESRSVVLSHAETLLASIGVDKHTCRAEKFSNGIAETTNDSDREASDIVSSSRSLTSREKRRERESKFVCNTRMKRELFRGDSLLYPTYREGLDAILKDPITPWQQEQQ